MPLSYAASWAAGMLLLVLAAGHQHRAATIRAATAGAPACETVAPTVTITSGPSGVMNSQDATVVVSSTESVSWTCSWNGAAYASCGIPEGLTGTTTYTGLPASSGVQTFGVKGADSCGNESTAATTSWMIGLPLLSCTADTSCDMDFRADAYSGSGNWQSSDSNAWVAVKTGSPGRYAATGITGGHYEVANFAGGSNYFATGSSNAHGWDGAWTVEAIVMAPPSVASCHMPWSNSVSGANTAVAYRSSVDFVVSFCPSAACSSSTYTPSPTSLHDRKYVLVHWTASTANGVRQYWNATQRGSNDAVASYAAAASKPWYIGVHANTTCGWGDNGVGVPLADGNGTVVQMLRHKIDMSATPGLITSRAAQFNAVKGY